MKEMFVGAFTMERFSKGCLKLKKNLHQKILRKKKKKGGIICLMDPMLQACTG